MKKRVKKMKKKKEIAWNQMLKIEGWKKSKKRT